MHKILISHEIPKTLFPFHNEINDYPYVLAHLLWESSPHYDEEYASFYKKVLKDSNYSILDNSCFELGESIPSEILFEICALYSPKFLVLPDIMGDCKGTIEATKQFLEGAKGRVKYMAVLQGKTVAEYKECLTYYNSVPEIEIVGINYRDLTDSTRIEFLQTMYEEGLLIKKIHLLGSSEPTEFIDYQNVPYRNLIFSLDTSSPIIHGWNLNKFQKEPLEKPSDLLADNLEIILNEQQLECIEHNVNEFKKYINEQ